MVGKNHDWMVEDGLIIVNKRGVSKTAVYGKHVKGRPATWISKYGSVTFNQYGREMPAGGMNEMGLVIENMQLVATKYPVPDSRPAISRSQWIQYQLDNFSTVKEIIASDSMLRIASGMGPGIHFLCVDREGNCATIEFLEGNLVYHTKDAMPFKVLTNSTYEDSVEFYRTHEESVKEFPMPIGSASRYRFIRAASMIEKFKADPSKSMVNYAFDILSNVSEGLLTKWSIVYDLKDFRIYFQTYTNPKRRYFDFNSFDFSCSAPVTILDINADLKDDVTHRFQDYSFQSNYNLIKNAFKKTTIFRDIPDEALRQLAFYPEYNSCKQ